MKYQIAGTDAEGNERPESIRNLTPEQFIEWFIVGIRKGYFTAGMLVDHTGCIAKFEVTGE